MEPKMLVFHLVLQFWNGMMVSKRLQRVN